MDLTFMMTYAIPSVVGICLCVGYVLKSAFPKFNNDFIPLTMLILGTIINIWIMKGVTPEVLLAGMFSGIASCGLHQNFKVLVKNLSKDDE